MSKNTKISVIIPVYNEANVIGECLQSLSIQTYKNFEVIVVDDGSPDNTADVVRNLKFKIKNLKLLRQQHLGPGSARNLGAKHAKGKILVFVDSDMTFDKNFLERLVAPILAGHSKGTFSREEIVSNPKNTWSLCWTINEGWEEGRRHPKNYQDKQKVFRAILKEEFDKAGGFTSIGYTDDWTLAEKLGYEAEVAPRAVFYHKNPETLQEVLNQAEWIGKRQYKWGRLGTIIAMIRASFLVSLVIGLIKSAVYKKPQFLIFKLVYDFGVFCGALFTLFGGGNAK